METVLINELLGPDAQYDRRARPQFDAVNVSLYYVLESILELVSTSFTTQMSDYNQPINTLVHVCALK